MKFIACERNCMMCFLSTERIYDKIFKRLRNLVLKVLHVKDLNELVMKNCHYYQFAYK